MVLNGPAACALRGNICRPLSWRALRPQSASRAIPTASRLPLRNLSSTAVRHNEDQRTWTTPLAKQLADAMMITGPVPLASYMRMCLTGDIGGYYTGLTEKNRDQFGLKGDFVTSPEISQIFGELVGIWFVAEWMSQGKPKNVHLIELGPGRGTLMDDILRTLSNFKDLTQSIETIYMVEASATLRETQKKLLCGAEAQVTESAVGHHSVSKHLGVPIIWAESVKAVPHHPSSVPFMVAHEFFDALPIHAFQTVTVNQQPKTPATTTPQPASPEAAVEASPAATKSETSSTDTTSTPTVEWRELVVSPVPPNSTHATLNTPQSQRDGPVPEFQLTQSTSPTHHARYVPESSPRYRALKTAAGATIEVCPDATMFAADLATRIGGSSDHPKPRPSGAALILDYGTSDTVPINSLRGIRRHRLVSPFTEPGLVDLSADVDFTALADSATKASPGVEVHGPVEQAAFLGQMGIRERAEMLTKRPGMPQKRQEDIDRSWRRLVDRGPGGMGKVYKVLAILPENRGQRRPVGFGGDI